jgi:hypothetical protein
MIELGMSRVIKWMNWGLKAKASCWNGMPKRKFVI